MTHGHKFRVSTSRWVREKDTLQLLLVAEPDPVKAWELARRSATGPFVEWVAPMTEADLRAQGIGPGECRVAR